MASQTSHPSRAAVETKSSGRFDQYLGRQLSKTGAHVKLVDLIATMSTVAVVTLATLLVVCIVDAWVLTLPAAFRLAILLGMVAYVGWVLLRSLVPLLVWRINPAYSARMIEQSEPRLKNSLLNYLFLRGRVAQNDPVFDAIQQRAAQDLSAISIESAVDRSRLIRVGFVLVVVVAACGLYKLLSPKDPVQTLKRVIAPLSQLQAPSRVRIIDVKPGSTEVFFGDSLEVTAEIRGINSASAVQLVVSSDDGQFIDAPLPMQATQTKSLFVGQLAPTPAGIQQGLRYRVVAGDGRSPEYTVRVHPSPTISVSAVEIHPPPYTELPIVRKEGQGDVEAIEHSLLRVETRANMPIASAYLELLKAQPGSSPATPPAYASVQRLNMQVHDQNAQIELKLGLQDRQPKYTHYRVRFNNGSGQTSRNEAIYSLKVLPDMAPEIQIERPATTESSVAVNGRLDVRVRAADADFRLAAVRLFVAHKGRLLLQQDLPLDPKTGVGNTVAEYSLRPAALHLKPGDEAMMYAMAIDNRHSDSGQPDPNQTRSGNHTLRITAPDPNQKGDDSANQQSNAGQQSSQQQGESGQGQSGDGQAKSKSSQSKDDQSSSGDQKNPDGASGGGQGESSQGESNEASQSGGTQGGADQNQAKQPDAGTQPDANQSGQSSDGSSGTSNGQSSGNGQSKPSTSADNAQNQMGSQADSQSPQSNDSQANPGGESSSGNEATTGSSTSNPNDSGQSRPMDESTPDGERIRRILDYRQKQMERSRSNSNQLEQSDQRSTTPPGNQNSPDSTGQPGESNRDGEQTNQGASDRESAQGSPSQAKDAATGNQTNSKGSENQSGGQSNLQQKDQGDPSSKGSENQPDGSGNRDPNDTRGSESNPSATANQETPPSSNDSAKGNETDAASNSSSQNTAGNEASGGEQSTNDQSAEMNKGQESKGQESNSEAEKPTEPNADNRQPVGDQNSDAGQPNQGSDESGQKNNSSGSSAKSGSPTAPSNESSNESEDNQADPKEGPSKSTDKRPQSIPFESPSETDFNPTTQTEIERENLEQSKAATDLVLDYLKNQENRPDPGLLNEMNWTDQEMADFIQRWEAMRKAAESGDSAAKERYEEALQSLGIRSKPVQVRRSAMRQESIENLNDDGAISRPPAAFERDFKEFLRRRSQADSGR